jgi:hypothetical protein
MPVKTMTTKKTTTTTTKKAPTPRAKVVDQVIPDLPSNPFAFEIFVLIWNFDESVISVLPPGDVPYAAVDEMDSFKGTLSEKIADAVEKMDELGTRSLGSQDQGRSSIRKEFKKFYNFIKGGNDGLSSLRKETMFINILQGLHPLEAEIICLTKDKKLQSKYKISKENVSEAYPDITWGNRS